MACFNGHPGQPSTFDRLHGLLDRQPYRLAHWKTAFDEINYRRFFDVNDLGGLRMEDARVFTAAHRLVLQLIAERKVSALRIDHPDGLLDPAAYLRRLKAATDRALAQTPGPVPHNGCDLLVEKILAPGEFLPETWPVAGTTGYGFLNAVGGLFVDPASADSLRRWYARTARQRDPFEEVVYHSKRLVMGSSMASELAVLARNLKAIAGSDRRTRDFTLTALRKTIVEVVACLPVYRTYVSAAGFSPADRERVDLAIDRARRRNPVMAQSLFRFLRGVLLPDDERLPAERLSAERRFAAKFQQFSAPVQAKGVEDTSFYRYNVLLSLNEVGGDPSGFGTSVEEFHGGNVVRLERWPREMISTATHDSKRGEDARARLNVLTEVPGPWRRSVSAWRRLNAVRRTAVDRQSAPDANDEYCFYQTLVAAWPAEPVDAPVPAEAPQALVERLRAYMLKAIKEAKVHTSWVNQNSAYEEALQRFVETTLRGPGARGFLKTAVPFVRRIAHAGTINSLAQLVLKVASPGVPDFYNGTETWQLDMADPDNRRPVDFPLRDNMLRELMPWLDRLESRQQPIQECPCPGPGEQHVESLLAEWWDSRIKMFLTAAGLRLRRRAPDVFIQGTYEPLRAVGDQAPHLVGFARTYDSEAAVAIVPRLMGGRCFSSGRLPTGPDAWGDTRIVLPAPLARRVFHHAFTGALVGPVEGGLLAADVLRTCPVALLVTEAAGRKFVT
jgi:(1->4)-alpha-D-glucan 1-alpha-D-glucosylmutase